METLIIHLNQSLNKAVSEKNNKECARVVSNILAVFEDEISPSDIDKIIAYLYDKEKLYKHARNITFYKYHKEAGNEMLKLFGFTINKFTQNVQKYILDFYEFCKDLIVRVDITADIKCNALIILTNIVEIKHSNPAIFRFSQLFVRLVQNLSFTKSQKVEGKTYILLGVISVKYPKEVEQHSIQFRKLLMAQLNIHMKKSKLENSAVEGLVQAFNSFLIHFSPPLETNAVFYLTLYNNIKKLIDLNPTKQKHISKEILSLIQEHINLFKSHIYVDYKFWHTKFVKSIYEERYTANVKTVGFTLDAFYKAIGEKLSLQTDSADKIVFNYFFQYFQEHLTQGTADNTLELRWSLKAIGHFAKSYRTYLSDSTFSEIFVLIMQRIRFLYLDKEEIATRDLEYLPTYVEVLCSVIKEMDQISDDDLKSLELLCVIMIRSFPKLRLQFHQKFVIQSFQLTIALVANSRAYNLENFLNTIIYQSVIWTSSHSLLIDAELMKEDVSNNIITYKNFLPFWTSVLNLEEDKFNINNIIYDEMIKTLFKLSKRLDLSIIINYSESVENKFVATSPKDCTLFINVVDFYVDIFSSTPLEYFQRYLYIYHETFIMLSEKNALNSGFYKLITQGLKNYNQLVSKNIVDIQNQEQFLNLIRFYICQLITKAKVYKGDLQVALLFCVLEVPLALVEEFIDNNIKEVIIIALNIGQLHLSLAMQVLKTLDNWNRNFSKKNMENLFKDIFPILEDILKSKPVETNYNLQIERKTNRYQKLLSKDVTISENSELTNLQKQILLLFGSLNFDLFYDLYNGDSSKIRTRHSNCLKYKIPFADIKLDVYLDEIIPHILGSALNASDRGTRVAACEFLHTCIIILTGTHAYNYGNRDCYIPLFEILWPALLQLANDNDHVVYQLFNPLLLQLIHWFVSSTQIQSGEIKLLINALMNSMSHSFNADFENFTGKYLCEFVKWSINLLLSDDVNAAEKCRTNLNMIFKQIIWFAKSGKVENRIGAAVAFTSCYSVLLENTNMELYSLDLLQGFIISLSMCNNDDELTKKCEEETTNALDKLYFMIEKEYVVLNQSTSSRPNILSDIVVWLIQQCGSLQIKCSFKAMELSAKLVKYAVAKDKFTMISFIETFLSIPQLINIFEGDLQKYSDDWTLEKAEHVIYIINWMKQLRTSLNCFTWALNLSINIDRHHILHKAIDTFFNHILFKKNSLSSYLSDANSSLIIQSIIQYENLKMKLIIDIFDFLILVSERNEQAFNDLCPLSLFNMINISLFESEKLLSYCTNNNYLITTLFPQIENLLSKTTAKMDPNKKEIFKLVMEENIRQFSALNIIERCLQSNENLLENKFKLLAIIILNKCEFLNINDFSSGTSIMNYIFENIVQDGVGLNIPMIKLEILKIAIEFALINCDPSVPITLICYGSTIRHPKTMLEVRHGIYFFNLFSDYLIEHYISHVNPENLFITTGNIDQILIISTEIFKHILQTSKDNLKSYSCTLFEYLLSKWETIQENAMNLNEKYRLLQFLKNGIFASYNERVGVLNNHSSNVESWIYGVITEEINESEDESLNLQYKINVLGLLPFITKEDDTNNFNLTSALETFFHQHCSKKTSSIQKNTTEEIVNKSVIKKCLNALVVTKSPTLLRFIIEYTKYDDEQIYKNDIEESLKILQTNANLSEQFRIIKYLFDDLMPYFMIFDATFTNQLVYCIHFVLLLIRHTQHEAIQRFLQEGFNSIIFRLSMKANEDASERKIEMIEKIISFQLIEYIFLLDMNDENLLEMSNFEYDRKKLTKTLVEKCLSIRMENYDVPPEIFDLYHLFQCISFRTLITIISNTQKELKPFRVLFYHRDNVTNSLLLWPKIINCTIPYTFPQDFDKLPSKRKVVVNIRNKIRKENHNFELMRNFNDFISTQNVFNSTLNEDVQKFDFTLSLVKKQNNTRINPELQANVFVELEEDALNTHECMAPLCAVVQQLIHLDKTEGKNSNGAPHWIQGIRQILNDNDVHGNIKIFLLKLIENNKDDFQCYSKIFIGTILNVIQSKVLGNEINYFIGDLLNMLLTWKNSDLDSNDISTLNKFLLFFIPRCYHERTDMFKYYVELLRNIIEIWKTHIHISNELLSYVSATHPENEIRLIELQLLTENILLSNNICIWTDSSKEKFNDSLLTYLKHSERRVYNLAAELLARVLCFFSENCGLPNIDNKLFKNSRYMIENLPGATKEDKFYHIVNVINQLYPEFIDSILLNIIFMFFKKVSGKFKVISLKVMVSRLFEFYEKLETFVTVTFFDELIGEPEIEVQLLMLQLFHKLLPKLSLALITNVIEKLLHFKLQKHANCRKVIYDISIDLIKKYQHNNSEMEQKLISLSQQILLSGLNDPDEEIVNKIHKFWIGITENCIETKKNFLKLSKDMYCNDFESSFLGNCLYFLLETTENSADFNGKLFENALIDCPFVDHKITVNWRVPTLSVIPLFAESVASQVSQMRLSQNIPFSNLHPLLQASQTQQKLNKNFIENDEEQIVATTSLHTFDNFKKPFSVKRRFLRNKATITKSVITSVRKNIEREKSILEDTQKRKHLDVKLSKSYRIGDFPDVEISHQSVIKSLQALIKRDPVVAQFFYVSTFEGLVQKDSTTDCEFLSSVSETFNSILKSSIQLTKPIVETIFSLSLKYQPLLNLHTDVIVTTSQQSYSLPAGCLLLENKIFHGFDETEPSSKRSTNFLLTEHNHWLKLAELYREMSEFDVVNEIFSEKIGQTAINKAVTSERHGKWKKALDIYEESLKSGSATSKAFKQFCFEASLNCFSQMSDWDSVMENTNNLIDSDLELLWKDEWHRDKLMPWVIRTHVHKMLFSDNIDDNLLARLNQWNDNKERSPYINYSLSKELILLYIFQDKFEQVNTVLELLETLYLNEWSIMSKELTKSKLKSLQNLKIYRDIKDFLAIKNHLNNVNYEENVLQIFDMWQNISNSRCDSLRQWESKVLYRNFFARNLLTYVKANNWESSEIQLSYDLTMKQMLFEFTDFALKGSNFHIARKYIKKIENIPGPITDLEKIKINLTKSKLLHMKVDDAQTEDYVYSYLTEAWKLLKKVYVLQENSVDNFLIKISSLQHEHKLLNNFANFINVCSPTNADKVQGFLNFNVNSARGEILQKIVILCEEQYAHNNSIQNQNILSDAYIKIASYCRNIDTPDKTILTNFIQSIMRCMFLNSRTAHYMFPCLLQKEEILFDEELRSCFLLESSRVPTWMFLTWIPQLLAILNSNWFEVIKDIILKVATTYPNAMIFSYRLSKEKMNINNNIAEFIRTLDELMPNSEIDKFLKALFYANVPETIFKFYLNMFTKIIDIDQMKIAWADLKKVLLSSNDIDLYGSQHKEYESSMNEIDNLISQNTFDVAVIKQHIQDIYNKFDKNVGEKRLADYSPWLVDYQNQKHANQIEIPGQYIRKFVKPVPQHHITIYKFKNKITVLKSLRKPVKLTIIGNDGIEYPFLLKFGEDLRQDERIQQIFSLMNEILKNASTNNKQMRLETYQVVPLTSRLGLVEWLNETKTLYDFGFHDTLEKMTKAQLNYMNWLLDAKGGKILNADTYYKAYEFYNKNQVIAKYRELSQYIPENTLRLKFINLSVTPNDFFSMRVQFSQTLAVLNVSHWILGIGDRHLENFLISLKTGRLIAIDFGYAFDIAIESLFIPEIVPFRLTPQILNVLAPLNELGYLRPTMVQCLQYYRQNLDQLLSVLEIFIHEPTLDWLEIIHNRSSNISEVEGSSKILEWYPKSKISAVEKKLRGAHPTKLMIKCLENNTAVANKESIIDIIKGIDGLDLRSNPKTDDLSEEQQIECLLDQAMDPNILGRMFHGWQAWI